MRALKYPLYFLICVFIILTVYALGTEKPRQYKVKSDDQSAPTTTLAEAWNDTGNTESQAAHDPVNTASVSHTKANHTSVSSAKPNVALDPEPPAPVVAAYSVNDAGGRIVLSSAKCDKANGLSAYTTNPNGKVDFGCWRADELYIIIDWNKEGVINYSYDRFFEVQSNERVKPRALVQIFTEGTKPTVTSASASASIPTTASIPANSHQLVNTGVKK